MPKIGIVTVYIWAIRDPRVYSAQPIGFTSHTTAQPSGFPSEGLAIETGSASAFALVFIS